MLIKVLCVRFLKGIILFAPLGKFRFYVVQIIMQNTLWCYVVQSSLVG